MAYLIKVLTDQTAHTVMGHMISLWHSATILRMAHRLSSAVLAVFLPMYV